MSDDEARAVMKRCQIGFPKHMIDESNGLHADCYGTIGWLLEANKELRKELAQLKSTAMKITTENTLKFVEGKDR